MNQCSFNSIQASSKPFEFPTQVPQLNEALRFRRQFPLRGVFGVQQFLAAGQASKCTALTNVHG